MNIIWFNDCGYKNKYIVGGKNASLGELYTLSSKLNFNIANGFALSTKMYDSFINFNDIEKFIKLQLNNFEPNNINILNNISENIKTKILNSKFEKENISNILENYEKLKKNYDSPIQLAVRSSAIAEDLPNASFAGQQDTYLNIVSEKELIEAVYKCYASLFNSRAISYRYTNNIHFSQVKMAIAIQTMVRSDLGSAGTAFSLDPESGYNKAIIINSSFGLGELVVSGAVKPDEIVIDKRALQENANYPIIDKIIGEKTSKIIYGNKNIQKIETNEYERTSFSLNDSLSIELAKYVVLIENEYQKLFSNKIGIDIEWAYDGNKIYIIQARPETIHSNKNSNILEKYILQEKSNVLIKGISVGEKITTGKICCLNSVDEYEKFQKGDILVTSMTTPDWEPIMKISSGIITDKGGRTCHAAIIARELNINAIVGTSNATNVLKSDQKITMSCSEGEIGNIYDRILKYKIEEYELNTECVKNINNLETNIMLNIGAPEKAFSASLLPNNGVGLARLEFIINNNIKIHPLALLKYKEDNEKNTNKQIKPIINNYLNGEDYFIKNLAMGIGKIASAFYPRQVIVRLSDFKSNEYRQLLGGDLFEPTEENPMIGWRGASRYYSKEYKEAFILECKAISYAIKCMKMNNITIMIPFCRTVEECKKVLKIMKYNGLKRGENGLKIYIMCEIPSNVIEADLFAPLIDGVSIGGNDLLQLTLGVDRDSDMITHLSDHTNISYRRLISQAIKTYKNYGVKVGFCGQQPSDSLEFCNFLIKEGIDSISVIPDSVLNIYNNIS